MWEGATALERGASEQMHPADSVLSGIKGVGAIPAPAQYHGVVEHPYTLSNLQLHCVSLYDGVARILPANNFMLRNAEE